MQDEKFAKKSIPLNNPRNVLIISIGFILISELILGFIFHFRGFKHLNLRIVTYNLLYIETCKNERVNKIYRVHSNTGEKTSFQIFYLYFFCGNIVIFVKQQIIFDC